MQNAICELSETEIDQVDGAGVAYVLGYLVLGAMGSASAFYGDMPAGYALL